MKKKCTKSTNRAKVKTKIELSKKSLVLFLCGFLLIITLSSCDKPAFLNPLDTDWDMSAEDWKPSNLQVTIVNGHTLSLTWVHDCSYEAGYIIERKTESTFFTEIGRTGANILVYRDVSCDIMVNYTYRVMAYIGEKYSEYSSELRNDSYEMVFVQGGSFQMGSNNGNSNEKPIHTVTVSDFYIGKYEVSVAQFSKFIELASYKTDSEKNGYSYIYDGSWEKKNGVTWMCGVKGNRYSQIKECNYPVIHISWNDAVAYCEWLSEETKNNYRLPTEAEWEYAARGGPSSQGYAYSGSNSISDVAWYNSNSGSKTHVVGDKQPNKLGLYAMSGNVYEWCWDWYGSYSSNIQTNPTGLSSGSYRVLRGGGWNVNVSHCRVGYRYKNYPSYTGISDGFRIASSAR